MAVRKRKTITNKNSKPLTTAAFKEFCNNKAGYKNTDIAAGETGRWTYIDFIDPYTKYPCLQFEYLFGARGFLTGRILKWEADEGDGKSSLSYLSFGMGQCSSNAMCMLEESERAQLADDRVAELGCDPAGLLVNKVTMLNDCLTHIDLFSRDIRELDPERNTPLMVCIDSLSGLSALEEEKKIEEALADVGRVNNMGKHARTLSGWFRDGATAMIEKEKMFLTFVGQLKQKISTGFGGFGGPEKSTLGGAAVNFHASFIVHLSGARLVYKEQHIGTRITMRCTKNKIAEGNRSIKINMYKQGGFRLGETLAKFLTDVRCGAKKDQKVCNITGGAGGWYSWPELCANKFQSKDLPGILYDPKNIDVLMGLREKLRIRGFGFKFETDLSIAHKEDTTAVALEETLDA